MRKIIEPCGLHCIKMHDIGVSFGDQVVLSGVNLHVHCGNLVAIIGKNGGGKSTLVRAIIGEIPHSGTIEFKNLKDEGVSRLGIGYVPQKLEIEKNTPLSVYDLFASYQTRVPVFLKKSRARREEYINILRQFEAEELIDSQVCNLSGGQLQRVMIALAVANGPDLLILDEPASAIDKNGLALFYRNIAHLKKHFDLAIILISHDLEYVREYADQVVLLDGTVRASGSPREVFASDAFREAFETPV